MSELTRAQIFSLLFGGGNYSKPYLIELTHPQAGVLRYVNNNESIVYNGHTFNSAGFKYTPPNAQGEGGNLNISAIDNYQLVEWIDKADYRYRLEVIGALYNGEVQPIRAYKHFYGKVGMGENNELSFQLENDQRLNMAFTVYKYDTDLNRGNA